MKPKLLISDAAKFFNCSPQNIHKILREKNFNAPKEDNRVYIEYKIAKVLFNIKFKRRIMAF